MNFIFWQNILSMHQSAFIRKLAEKNSILLIADKEIEKSMLNSGWRIPDFGKTSIEIGPNKNRIRDLLENNKNAIHVFSGIRAFPTVHYAFRSAIKKKIRIGIIAEAGMGLGITGYLRRLKTILLKICYSKNIDFILAMGDLGVEWYSNNYFPNNKIFPFLYTVEKPQINKEVNKEDLSSSLVKLIVIAQLINRKGIDILIKALSPITSENWSLKIIGEGDEKENIINMIKGTALQNKIFFSGAIPNHDAMKILSVCDLLILPSRFDGWGAVVNEALIRGVPVIVSDKCGASCLIDGQVRGAVFKHNDSSLVSILEHWIKRGPTKQSTRNQIASWADCLSGENTANYFLEIIECVYKSANRPIATWLKNDKL